jgi:hypothetical protein
MSKPKLPELIYQPLLFRKIHICFPSKTREKFQKNFVSLFIPFSAGRQALCNQRFLNALMTSC